ncbi:MAG: metal ABC transporter permease [Gammaproteobacteria bacterium]|nr:metal ABC transporter permease [Gammaproteobacteria bacterium]
MNWAMVADPLFHLPFAAGLVIALVLPLLGVLLRLRDEWLAALGLAHLAGASGLVGLAVGLPVVLGAPLGALVGAALKTFGRFRGNTVYGVMILVGWATTLLVAANTALGSVMGHALVEGQLYFAGPIHLGSALVFAVVAAAVLPWVMPRLIRARLFPGHETSNRLPAWRWHLAFDMLVALGMAMGTGILGLMGAFALVFVPPWVAFRLAPHWRACLVISAAIAVVAYLVAFAIALAGDQPFGPVLVAVLVAAGGLALVPVRR